MIKKTTKADKREALIEAGRSIMLRKGYHGTGVKEIVDAAGVPKGSFYNYFKSKEDFVLYAMEHVGRKEAEAFEQVLQNSNLSPAERIITAFTGMMEKFERLQNFTEGCFVGNMCQEISDTSSRAAEKSEYLFRNYTAPLAQCLKELQSQAPSISHMDPNKLAEFIFNSWEGAVLRMKSSRNTLPLRAFVDTIRLLLTKI